MLHDLLHFLSPDKVIAMWQLITWDKILMLMADPAMHAYLVSLLFSFYGIVLFSWWWWRNGAASSVFMYVTFIFAGEFVENAFSIYARLLLKLFGAGQWAVFISDSVLWPLRKIPTSLALLALVIHMTYRIFWGRRNIPLHNSGRRLQDQHDDYGKAKVERDERLS